MNSSNERTPIFNTADCLRGRRRGIKTNLLDSKRDMMYIPGLIYSSFRLLDQDQ